MSEKNNITDERLEQLANDPMMCNISPEVKECLQELIRLRKERGRLKAALADFYDKWEEGTTCYEDVEEETGCLGNAVKLSFAEEQEILNLIVDKAEDFEQVCANCNKPYRAHLLHDGNKCSPGSVNGWFPKTLADAIQSSRGTDAARPVADCISPVKEIAGLG